MWKHFSNANRKREEENGINFKTGNMSIFGIICGIVQFRRRIAL